MAEAAALTQQKCMTFRYNRYYTGNFSKNSSSISTWSPILISLTSQGFFPLTPEEKDQAQTVSYLAILQTDHKHGEKWRKKAREKGEESLFVLPYLTFVLLNLGQI